ncbi:universal stress protein [Streptomyces lunaelactis]|uniref:universal stress protein n=1 Tax=Streptomyces lunaelactis TaxID=1535768 RepID=UPI00158524BE|nr:universal stress protein [Streptomyces lunaelactis]NUK02579.1 universal stress protein [Streptomyces lunaelactis]NUK16635.1 universal stress protein [Streptomyces lunaelactis]
MELPLVVGVDGSESSLRAVDWAADEAALHRAPLRLVNASLWERYEGAALADDLGKPSERVLAENIVASATDRARRRSPDLNISTDILPEDAVTALLHEGRNASALVIGSHGRSGIAELLLGSVSLAVAARADCTVIVLRGGHDRRPGRGIHQRIVLGVDEPQEGSAAVRFAFLEAEARHAELHAVRAWRRPAHETTEHPLPAGEPARYDENRAVETVEEALRAAVAEHPSVELHRRTVEGPARTVLMDASATADLLVVGAERRHGHVGLQLGRVAHAVLHRAVCPVAVVPQWV